MRLNTPVELHLLKDRNVYVKRDDLMGDGDTLPPWGKMAGIDRLLENLNPNYPLIHLAVNGSWSGWALSYLCKQRGIKFIYAYPPSKTYNKFILEKAAKYDCDFKELTPNMMAILYNRIGSASEDGKTSFLNKSDTTLNSKSNVYSTDKDFVGTNVTLEKTNVFGEPYEVLEKKKPKYKKMVVKDSFLKEYGDVQMLPYAFDHIDYRKVLKERAQEVFKEHLIDHLVISAGSGVTSSGIVEAFLPGDELFSNTKNQKQAHIITVSNINTIYEKYKSHSIGSSAIRVDKTKFLFEDMMKNYEVPFPCNGTWDRKAWWWLEQNIEQLEGDILFWNIGGNV
mgnify:CR=1 FL=1